jgi:ATP-dependent DNA helicase RecG
MAPTEILARQHYETMAAPLEAQGTAGDPADRPRQGRGAGLEILAHAGRRLGPAVAVGTHALFQDRRRRSSALALTIIDEQHRFGVNERKPAAGQGGRNATCWRCRPRRSLGPWN